MSILYTVWENHWEQENRKQEWLNFLNKIIEETLKNDIFAWEETDSWWSFPLWNQTSWFYEKSTVIDKLWLKEAKTNVTELHLKIVKELVNSGMFTIEENSLQKKDDATEWKIDFALKLHGQILEKGKFYIDVKKTREELSAFLAVDYPLGEEKIWF